MITDPSEYEFVSGINGTVVIDGGIMPARDVALATQASVPPLMHPRCLRGEDIAFLAECAGQRNTVMSQSTQARRAYSREISTTQVDGIQSSLASYIRTPADAYSNLYVKPDYNFYDTRVDITQYVSPSWTLMSQNFFSLAYPGAAYSTPASHAVGNSLAGDDIRAMFYDAQMTTRPVPTANTWDLVLPLVPPLSANTTIESTIQTELHKANWTDPTPGGDGSMYEDTGSIYMCGVGGYGYPDRYFKYSFTANSFTMNVTVPQVARNWLSSDVTAIVFVVQVVNYVTWNGSTYVQSSGPYDLFGFPFSKTINSLGRVTIDMTDLQHILDTCAASLTERGIEEFGWQGNRFVFNRYNYILGCPLICRLNDHTDFSSLGWNWTP